MRKSFGSRFLSLILAAVLALGVLPAALAENAETVHCWNLEGNWSWFYIPSTVPDRFLQNGYWFVELSQDSGGNSLYETAKNLRIDFVSGDAHLKDGFSIEELEHYSGGTYPAFCVDLKKVTEPGRALFHLTADSEHMHYEKDMPLLVLSWDEDPLFSIEEKPTPDMITTTPGQIVSDAAITGYSSIVDHSGEIAEKYAQDGDTTGWARLSMDLFFIDAETGEYCGSMGYPAGNGYPEQPAEGYQIENLYSSKTGRYVSWRFNRAGAYRSEYRIYFGTSNIDAELEAPDVHVLPYRIEGSAAIAPGASAEYTAVDLEPDSGRSFTMSLEGEGVTLTESTANSGVWTVSAAEDAELGTSFTLTAAPSDGGTPAVLTGTVNDGALAGISLESREIAAGAGFSGPVFPSGTGEYETGYSGYYYNNLISRSIDRTAPNAAGLQDTVYGASFFPNREAKESYLKAKLTKFLDGAETVDLAEEMTEVLGEPALMATGMVKREEGISPFGVIYTVQNNVLLRVLLTINFAPAGEAKKVTMSDMRRLAEKIGYDESKAYLTKADGALTVSAKNGETAVTGGKKVQMTAAFANTEKVNKKEKNDGVEWSVIDLETGEAPADITIDKKGSLSAKKDLAVIRKLQVKAVSTTFYTEGTCEITAIPAVKKVTLEPAELFFYTGTEETKTVKAVLDPDTVPPIGITWTPAKEGLLEIEAGEDGTAKIRPLAGGKTTVAVKEPGGKNAKLTVSVVDPVTEVALTAKGKAQAGKTVTLSAALSPKTAGNKNLEWSLDVDESIATIDAKGKLKISKDAPAGTVITVTCTALGAPQPVAATLKITVE